jgi:hypothetical protein
MSKNTDEKNGKSNFIQENSPIPNDFIEEVFASIQNFYKEKG